MKGITQSKPSDWQEEVSFFAKDASLTPLLLEAARFDIKRTFKRYYRDGASAYLMEKLI